MARWSRLGRCAALTVVTLLSEGVAWAEEPATGRKSAPAAASAPSATDVVRLKNGGLVRGTISELVPNASVTIVTLTGEARKLDMTEVSYAGPAANDPGAAAAAPAPAPAIAKEAEPDDAQPDGRPREYVTVNARKAHVHLVSEPPGLVFSRQTAKAFSRNNSATGYERLCAAPCAITLPAGTETIAVGRHDRHPYKIQAISIPEGHSELHAHFEDKQGKRNIGWIIMGAGVIGGGVLMGLSVANSGEGDDESTGKLFATAAWATVGVGVGVGLYFVLLSDSAHFEQLPGARPPTADKQTSLIPGLRGAF